jgi:hypothetical protein
MAVQPVGFQMAIIRRRKTVNGGVGWDEQQPCGVDLLISRSEASYRLGA